MKNSRLLLVGGAALLAAFWLGHRVLSHGNNDKVIAGDILAAVNAPPDPATHGNAFVMNACLRAPIDHPMFHDEIPDTMPGDQSWVLVKPTGDFGMMTQAVYFGSVHRDKAPGTPFLAGLLEGGAIHRVPVEWLRFIRGTERAGIADQLGGMAGDILLGTPSDGFTFVTEKVEMGAGRTPAIITGPSPEEPRPQTPPGIRAISGICWRLKAERVLEISDVLHESSGSRTVVAAIMRRPRNLPSWLTDPRVAGAGYVGQVLTTDVQLYQFHDYGAGWKLDPMLYTSSLADLSMHPVGP
ncbi:hypothetical protein HKD24_14340 [Gluconobacter sp. LMG 31484]|uniref:Uncharacterized protein n=1 Tax=Gluconobacter vitians TaxID=2728102 RepID=A0ABR9Y8V1_9PROT|nr:hypothetical protein [Gluconobacter vitians]MBF0860361.1 hypothetical protein [Gluconobacter vitians]